MTIATESARSQRDASLASMFGRAVDQEILALRGLGGETGQKRKWLDGTLGVGLEWRAFGPVEVLVEGRLVDLGTPRQRALFGCC
jgi:hypothetical protein